MTNLEVNFCGVRFKNPVVASSAEPTLNADNMMKCIDTGAGGVIAGTNGAYDWRDIVMFIMSGAHIVEMCSAVMVYGYDWLEKQVRGLEKFMDAKGYERVVEMWGIAADASLAYADMPKEFARVNPEYCNYCQRCLRTCFYKAMQDGGDKVWVQEDNCVGCGGCLSVCPVPGAIDIFIHP